MFVEPPHPRYARCGGSAGFAVSCESAPEARIDFRRLKPLRQTVACHVRPRPDRVGNDFYAPAGRRVVPVDEGDESAGGKHRRVRLRASVTNYFAAARQRGSGSGVVTARTSAAAFAQVRRRELRAGWWGNLPSTNASICRPCSSKPRERGARGIRPTQAGGGAQNEARVRRRRTRYG